MTFAVSKARLGLVLGLVCSLGWFSESLIIQNLAIVSVGAIGFAYVASIPHGPWSLEPRAVDQIHAAILGGVFYPAARQQALEYRCCRHANALIWFCYFTLRQILFIFYPVCQGVITWNVIE
ncbi:MAG: hypothetical protein K0S29_946 [Gammaproteobacteria bacterium]|nr:hypothetical protein [Gammaproteobacteria bacterium]